MDYIPWFPRRPLVIVHSFNIPLILIDHRKQTCHWSFIRMLIRQIRFPLRASSRFSGGCPRSSKIAEHLTGEACAKPDPEYCAETSGSIGHAKYAA